MSRKRCKLVSTRELDEDFPLAIQTLYNGKSEGRYHWLTRANPDGTRGKVLWIDVDAFNKWAWKQGMKYRLQAPTRSWEH